MTDRVCAIFGGAGFIGSFFAVECLERKLVDKVLILDIEPRCSSRFEKFLSEYIQNGKIEYIFCDVRNDIADQIFSIDGITLIANFAAVHREPGHETYEYYETNILGAENVCSWASAVDCDNVIFTSSIAPYGPSEDEKTEKSLPVPDSAYGGSKLVAEKIHLAWAVQKSSRKLTIVRPGVVFGPGEGGNVSRLVKATVRGYFFYMGNKSTRKAGTYVKELTRAMLWVHEKSLNSSNPSTVFNMTMCPAPSVSEYVSAIMAVSGRKRKILSMPFGLMLSFSYLIDFLSSVLRVNQPISPVRIKKLVRSNNIVPDYLVANGYLYKYDLLSALEDWRLDAPDEWK